MSLSCPTDLFSGLKTLSDQLLDFLYFALEAAALSSPVIDFNGTADAITVSLERVEAAAHYGQHLVQFSLECGSHGVETEVESAGGHHFQTAGYVGADALPLPQGRHAEIKQDHLSSLAAMPPRGA
jgi:hypothetical protein